MPRDLIVSFLSSVPPSVLSRFTVPPLTLAVPSAPLGHGRTFYADWLQSVKDGKGNVIPGMFAKAGGTGTIGRVAVMGFSNGVDSGVSQVLDANDAQKIDFIGAFDGIHGSFLGGKIYPPAYGKWIAYATLAGQSMKPDAPCLVVTHSSIEPPFPSTTETANAIWDAVIPRIPQNYAQTYLSELDDIVYPGGMSIHSVNTGQAPGTAMPAWTWQSFNDGWYDRRNANNFSIFGWGDPGRMPLGRVLAACRDRFNNTADHIFQAQAVLPAILNAYLVNRWNPNCGAIPMNGFGADSCVPGEGRGYDAGPDGPLVSPFPLGVGIPRAPIACPYPPPGQVIVGSKDDPCATVPGKLPAPPGPVNNSGGTPTIPWLAGAAGVAAGYWGVRWLRRR